jgi:hypothetical protein
MSSGSRMHLKYRASYAKHWPVKSESEMAAQANKMIDSKLSYFTRELFKYKLDYIRVAYIKSDSSISISDLTLLKILRDMIIYKKFRS